MFDLHVYSAMAEELTALHQTHTWDLVSLPVGKRYSQEYDMDYEETFAPVAKMTTVRTLIVVASSEVYKLWKALYGLKQALRAWYEKFSTIVTSLRFVASHHDSALFVKRSRTRRILLSLYVDDMIITGDDYYGIELLKAELSLRFAIMTDNMIAKIPIDVKAKYTPTDGDPLPDPSLYRTMVGSLVYLTVILLMLSKLLISLLLLQLQYIGLLSYRFFCIFMRFAYLVESKKRVFLSKSSTEVEYHAMAVTTSKIVWLRWLLTDMGVQITSPTLLYCDNRSAIQIACNTIIDILTKPHHGSRFHFLSDKLSMFLAGAL
ncbi:uncharacterized mitochondrial protein-like protein [Tanacetum coccineum]